MMSEYTERRVEQLAFLTQATLTGKKRHCHPPHLLQRLSCDI